MCENNDAAAAAEKRQQRSLKTLGFSVTQLWRSCRRVAANFDWEASDVSWRRGEYDAVVVVVVGAMWMKLLHGQTGMLLH